jgi:hypothetical protein
MKSKRFRRIALSLPEATEGAHMGHPDFRIHGRIFATIQPGAKTGMVKLTPDQQQQFLQGDAAAFTTESGAWGRWGCTRVNLKLVDEDTLGEAMTLAWQNCSRKTAKSR